MGKIFLAAKISPYSWFSHCFLLLLFFCVFFFVLFCFCVVFFRVFFVFFFFVFNGGRGGDFFIFKSQDSCKSENIKN